MGEYQQLRNYLYSKKNKLEVHKSVFYSILKQIQKNKKILSFEQENNYINKQVIEKITDSVFSNESRETKRFIVEILKEYFWLGSFEKIHSKMFFQILNENLLINIKEKEFSHENSNRVYLGYKYRHINKLHKVNKKKYECDNLVKIKENVRYVDGDIDSQLYLLNHKNKILLMDLNSNFQNLKISFKQKIKFFKILTFKELSFIFIYSYDNNLSLYNVNKSDVVLFEKHFTNVLETIMYDQKNLKVFFITFNSTLYIYDFFPQQQKVLVENEKKKYDSIITANLIVPEKNLLILAVLKNKIQIYDYQMKKLKKILVEEFYLQLDQWNRDIRGLTYSTYQQGLILSHNHWKEITVWNYQKSESGNGAIEAKLVGHKGRIVKMQSINDSHEIVSVDDIYEMRIWNLKMNASLMVFDLLDYFQKHKLIFMNLFTSANAIHLLSDKILTFQKVKRQIENLNHQFIHFGFDYSNNHLLLAYHKSLKIIDLNSGKIYLKLKSLYTHQETKAIIFKSYFKERFHLVYDGEYVKLINDINYQEISSLKISEIKLVFFLEKTHQFIFCSDRLQVYQIDETFKFTFIKNLYQFHPKDYLVDLIYQSEMGLFITTHLNGISMVWDEKSLTKITEFKKEVKAIQKMSFINREKTLFYTMDIMNTVCLYKLKSELKFKGESPVLYLGNFKLNKDYIDMFWFDISQEEYQKIYQKDSQNDRHQLLIIFEEKKIQTFDFYQYFSYFIELNQVKNEKMIHFQQIVRKTLQRRKTVNLIGKTVALYEYLIDTKQIEKPFKRKMFQVENYLYLCYQKNKNLKFVQIGSFEVKEKLNLEETSQNSKNKIFKPKFELICEKFDYLNLNSIEIVKKFYLIKKERNKLKELLDNQLVQKQFFYNQRQQFQKELYQKLKIKKRNQSQILNTLPQDIKYYNEIYSNVFKKYNCNNIGDKFDRRFLGKSLSQIELLNMINKKRMKKSETITNIKIKKRKNELKHLNENNQKENKFRVLK